MEDQYSSGLGARLKSWGMKLQIEGIQNLQEHTAPGPSLPLQGTAKLALLPVAVTGVGGPSQRLPPSKRQDTWVVMASYLYTGVNGWGKQ